MQHVIPRIVKDLYRYNREVLDRFKNKKESLELRKEKAGVASM